MTEEPKKNHKKTLQEHWKDRRVRWRQKKAAAGLCLQCGEPAADGGVRCVACRTKQREQNRKATGCRPWTPGGKGRPPLERRED